VGDADATLGVGAVAGDLAREVQRTDAGLAVERLVVEQRGGHDPRHLELVAVGVLGVQALRRAVVTGAHERTVRLEHVGEAGQLRQRVDLPCQVVEADGAAAGVRGPGSGADLERAEVVVVGRARRLEERPRPGMAITVRKPRTSS
jgi:hypothetical protein